MSHQLDTRLITADQNAMTRFSFGSRTHIYPRGQAHITHISYKNISYQHNGQQNNPSNTEHETPKYVLLFTKAANRNLLKTPTPRLN